MKIAKTLFTSVVLAALLSSCIQPPKAPVPVARDQVFKSTLKSVRLGDGVPLNIDVAVRWKINDYITFKEQFESPGKYDSLILSPRELELANDVGNRYTNVDTLFNTQRHAFIKELKQYLLSHLGESGVEIKEVIISDIEFPRSYTDSKEKLAMLEQKLEQIRKEDLLEKQRAKSATEKAKADGQVAMVRAEMDAKVQKIKAETEKSRRLSRLAKAETEKQVARSRAESEADRLKLLAKADLEKKRDIQALDMQKRRDLDNIELSKTQKIEDQKFSNEMKMAKLCSENPVYAKYIVNKELASKVKIAVLPSGQGGSDVFNGLLNNNINQ